MQVATLEAAARQMSAYAQSNRLKQLASLIVARTSPAEVRKLKTRCVPTHPLASP